MARFPCGNCGSETHTAWKKVLPIKGDAYEVCSDCSRVKAPRVYDDVYKGDCGKGTTTDPNLCDPVTGAEIPYSSPGEKSAIMQRLGVRQAESAERQRGVLNEEISNFDKRRHFTVGS